MSRAKQTIRAKRIRQSKYRAAIERVELSIQCENCRPTDQRRLDMQFLSFGAVHGSMEKRKRVLARRNLKNQRGRRGDVETTMIMIVAGRSTSPVDLGSMSSTSVGLVQPTFNNFAFNFHSSGRRRRRRDNSMLCSIISAKDKIPNGLIESSPLTCGQES